MATAANFSFKGWTTQVATPIFDGNYADSINPLEEMVTFFVELLEDEGLVLSFTHGQKNHVKVGVETTDKGHTSRILNDPLNAIEFSSSLSIMKSNICINC